MWNKRKQEPPAPKPAATIPRPTDLSREGIPIQTAPTKVVEPGGGAAAIGKSVVVKGQIFSREDLYVDGEVDGSIEVQEHKLTVGPNGRVKATIQAREVVVRGAVHGDVDAGDRVEIRREAKVVGDLRTGRILIEDGAFFKGSVDMRRPEVTRSPAVAMAGAAAEPSLRSEAPRPARQPAG